MLFSSSGWKGGANWLKQFILKAGFETSGFKSDHLLNRNKIYISFTFSAASLAPDPHLSLGSRSRSLSLWACSSFQEWKTHPDSVIWFRPGSDPLPGCTLVAVTSTEWVYQERSGTPDNSRKQSCLLQTFPSSFYWILWFPLAAGIISSIQPCYVGWHFHGRHI